MKKVMVFGTFDTLHRGHLFFLKQAASRGDYLIAVVAGDRAVDELKGRNPIHKYKNRIENIEKSGLVNKTLPSDKIRGSWGVIQRERPHVICLGHDQSGMEENLRSWLEKQEDYSPEIIILPPYKRHFYSSTAHRKRRAYLFYLILLAAMMIMALSWISGKVVSTQAPFTVLVFWRFFFSLIPFIPFTRNKEWFKIPLKGLLFTLLSALFLLLYNYLFFNGLVLGLAGKGGVLVTTLNPLFTTLIFLLLEKRLPSLKMLGGLIIGFSGGILLMEPWLFTQGEIISRGNIFFFFAAASWALLTICSGKAQIYLPLRKYNFYLYSITSLVSLFLALPDHPFEFSQLAFPFWINIVYLSLFVTSLATSLYFSATKKLGAPRASSFTFIIPGLALFFSWLILGEIPQLPTLIGGSLSITALVIINRTKDK